MRILVTGGRKYDNGAFVYRVLNSWLELNDIDMLIQGGADGADAWARAWADHRLIPCLNVPARWGIDGLLAAGPLRNGRMLTYSPQVVIAFPGNSGTENMKM